MKSNRKMNPARIMLAICLTIFCIGTAGVLSWASIIGAKPVAAASAPSTCGTVTVRMGGQMPSEVNANHSEQCLAQAYRLCQPASLTYTQASIDTGTKRQFSVVRHGGRCQISEVVTQYTIPTHNDHVTYYTCSSLYEGRYGLYIRDCSADGNVFIPARINRIPTPMPTLPIKHPHNPPTYAA
ncbi:hypothetical protein KDW_45320 [Dictyobacter vulcani]|uniref:Uncharacterized protein n=1 Tax=Dictyobacter vulcani TaxID=2607529 RepID=A0A5J4KV26_9CHLR|nr:hypothetical protein [Dictyobacter vulcani]GER90370.1 hypothetical protein KDW_45320 [Dictyobacter vulcani]